MLVVSNTPNLAGSDTRPRLQTWLKVTVKIVSKVAKSEPCLHRDVRPAPRCPAASRWRRLSACSAGCRSRPGGVARGAARFPGHERLRHSTRSLSVIGCHWLPFLRDSHSNLAAIGIIFVGMTVPSSAARSRSRAGPRRARESGCGPAARAWRARGCSTEYNNITQRL
jgi:hypothetical protein